MSLLAADAGDSQHLKSAIAEPMPIELQPRVNDASHCQPVRFNSQLNFCGGVSHPATLTCRINSCSAVYHGVIEDPL
jgi:hypothetical protein